MGKGTAAALTSVAAQRRLAEANLKAATTYRVLTKEESSNLWAARAAHKLNGLRLFSRKQLSFVEARALITTKTLTKEQMLQLVALKRVTAADAEKILIDKNLSVAEKQLLQDEIVRAAAAKRSTVIWSQLKASMAGALGALKSFALASLPLAAIGAVMALWQRNSEEAQKAKDISDGLFNKAVDSAKELNSMLETLGSSDALSNLELSQGIEQMENKIKDLSPTPIEDINNSLVAQDGHVRTLAERFDFLKGRLEEVRDAYQLTIDKKFSDSIEGALKATDGNWLTKFFNDDLITNAKDYTNALKRREDRLSQFAANNRRELAGLIDQISKTDTEFAKAVEGMASYEEKLRELITFSDGKYLQTSLLGQTVGGLGNVKKIEDAYNELLADTDKFVADLNAKLKSMKINPAAMTEEQRTALTM